MAAPEGNNYAEGNEGGRPSEYQPEYAKQVHKLCLLGATDAQIADFFGVTERTIHNWKKEHQEFFHSVSQGKIMADAEIAESLYKRAKGYRYNEITREGELPQGDEAKDTDSDQVNELKVTKIVTKELPPDASAAMHWLKNRQPALWRDKQILGHEGEVTVTVIRTDPQPRDDS